MRIIFLDIDGVLNNDASIAAHGTNLKPDAENVRLANSIAHRADARIVVSSNWREGKPLWMVQAILGQHLGITADIIGMTPDLKTLEGLAEDRHQLRIRGLEISRWLEKNPWVSRYAVIDDRAVVGHDASFFRTDPAVGLTTNMADVIIAHLTRNP